MGISIWYILGATIIAVSSKVAVIARLELAVHYSYSYIMNYHSFTDVNSSFAEVLLHNKVKVHSN